jgi:hypothetical protein
VYCAAFNFWLEVVRNAAMYAIAKVMLTAEYQATVLAAWELSLKYPQRAGQEAVFDADWRRRLSEPDRNDM